MPSGHHKLIDLDASVQIGAPLGSKLSSAYAPPEMLIQLDDRTAVRSCRNNGVVPDGPFSLLDAAPSYDIFSFGCIFMSSLARRQLIVVSPSSTDPLLVHISDSRNAPF